MENLFGAMFGSTGWVGLASLVMLLGLAVFGMAGAGDGDGDGDSGDGGGD